MTVGPEHDEGETVGRGSRGHAARWLIVLLVTYRLLYHLTYIGEVPFALGTFSDGAVYEAMARDILAAPPWGSEAFYLQGLYGYFMALTMVAVPWVGMVLLGQLGLAAGSIFLFFRASRNLWGSSVAYASTATFLLYPGLAFYENKFLSAELGVATNILVLWCFSRLMGRTGARPGRPMKRRGAWICLALGMASGVCVLARPNMALALPFTAVAILYVMRGMSLDPSEVPSGRSLFGGGAPTRTWRALLLWILGVTLALAPMAIRNQFVTGSPDISPIHGGGTSFYIGNNPEARGVWNGGGLLSGRLGAESTELAAQLNIDEADPRAEARAIGDALYARAGAWIREHPGDWLKLEARKAWLLVGNDEITQDHDWYGERELIPWAHRIGVPFGTLVGLGLIGLWAVRRLSAPGAAAGPVVFEDPPQGRWQRRALLWFVAGQVVAPAAANLLFFTSSQHRLPLAVPLALLAGPAIVALHRAWVRSRGQVGEQVGAPKPGKGRPGLVISLLAVAIAAQGFVPRLKRHAPHPTHYYNLALVQDEAGDPRAALETLHRAVELRPEHPYYRLRRAHLYLRLGDHDRAEQDIRRVLATPELPEWARHNARRELAFVLAGRRLDAPKG